MTDWHRDLVDALAQPGPASWQTVVRIGNSLLKRADDLPARMDRAFFLRVLGDRLPSWPRELARKAPARWPREWRDVSDARVREIDTYGRYIVGVCGDPRLRRADGGQAVRLRRRWVGAARSFSGNHVLKLGEEGEPDLQGWIVLDTSFGHLPVTCALEVKEPGGSLSPEQEKWRDAALMSGLVYVVAFTVEEAVLSFSAARARLSARLP